MCGHMKPGESILIHAGSGGVGQAAINVCLHYNCTIFTTVSSPEKREFIRKTFPAVRIYLFNLFSSSDSFNWKMYAITFLCIRFLIHTSVIPEIHLSNSWSCLKLKEKVCI